jgi:pimeloyl-ACP methyl ester carboxylesterase
LPRQSEVVRCMLELLSLVAPGCCSPDPVSGPLTGRSPRHEGSRPSVGCSPAEPVRGWGKMVFEPSLREVVIGIRSLRRRVAGQRLIVVGSIAVLITGCRSDSGEGAETTVRGATTTAASSPQPERAGAVDIGDGREIYLQCSGTGGPTVVLVSGFPDGAAAWGELSEQSAGASPVFADVAAFVRVCAYDRPGTGSGRSTAVEQPTSGQDAAADLERVLAASGEVGPYVLVGHSYGGPVIRLFASTYPSQTAGLVLVDGLSEDLLDGLTAAQRAVYVEMNSPLPDPGAEDVDWDATFEQLRDSGPVPDVPVIVLTADHPQLTPEMLASGQLPEAVDQEFADALWKAQMAAQDRLAALFPDGQHITETNSTHYIQRDNPQLVVDSIRDVVESVRRAHPGG